MKELTPIKNTSGDECAPIEEAGPRRSGMWLVRTDPFHKRIVYAVPSNREPTRRYAWTDDSITAGQPIDPEDAVSDDSDLDASTIEMVAEAEEDVRAGKWIDGEELRGQG